MSIDKKTAGVALRRAAGKLLEAGMEKKTAFIEGRLLLGKAWGKEGIELITSLRDDLALDLEMKYEDLVARRLQGEPLQYILGQQEFMGLVFQVSPAVLIPRWDTEVLVNETLKIAQELGAAKVLDLGTGSGAVAISLAIYAPQIQVVAVDISFSALKIARENAILHGVLDRVDLRQGDLFSPLGKKERFHLIVSNPPYIARKEYYQLSPEVKEEPFAALDGGEDGLEFYRRIGAEALEHLEDGGHLILEIGWEQKESVLGILKKNGFDVLEVTKDYGGKDRVVKGTLKRG